MTFIALLERQKRTLKIIKGNYAISSLGVAKDVLKKDIELVLDTRFSTSLKPIDKAP